jgi:hypothetical protein
MYMRTAQLQWSTPVAESQATATQAASYKAPRHPRHYQVSESSFTEPGAPRKSGIPLLGIPSSQLYHYMPLYATTTYILPSGVRVVYVCACVCLQSFPLCACVFPPQTTGSLHLQCISKSCPSSLLPSSCPVRGALWSCWQREAIAIRPGSTDEGLASRWSPKSLTTHHSTVVKSSPLQRSSRTDHRSAERPSPMMAVNPPPREREATGLRKFHPSREGWIPGARAGQGRDR